MVGPTTDPFSRSNKVTFTGLLNIRLHFCHLDPFLHFSLYSGPPPPQPVDKLASKEYLGY